MLLPWFAPEITPLVLEPGVRRFALAVDDGPGHVRAVVEAQMMALARHLRWMQVDVTTIHAIGGASANRDILRVMADVFGAEMCQFEVGNSACPGAALRARHAGAVARGERLTWDEVVAGVVDPLITVRLQPDRERHAIDVDLMRA